MKRFLVLTLILTIIFPAYCFATPQRIIPTADEMLEEIMLIIEDGVVEEDEISSFIAMGYDDEIIVSQIDYKLLFVLSTVALIIMLLVQIDFVGGIAEILLDAYILFLGFGYLVQIFLFGTMI